MHLVQHNNCQDRNLCNRFLFLDPLDLHMFQLGIIWGNYQYLWDQYLLLRNSIQLDMELDEQ